MLLLLLLFNGLEERFISGSYSIHTGDSPTPSALELGALARMGLEEAQH